VAALLVRRVVLPVRKAVVLLARRAAALLVRRVVLPVRKAVVLLARRAAALLVRRVAVLAVRRDRRRPAPQVGVDAARAARAGVARGPEPSPPLPEAFGVWG
ncbi:hypothetical protein, partial [Streptomyces xanthochromogenes]|uniref:hypothetical protein n=1 Tax=Streptomyces xanthochromogenes TaxID=67384 RepID=UPI00332F7DD3